MSVTTESLINNISKTMRQSQLHLRSEIYVEESLVFTIKDNRTAGILISSRIMTVEQTHEAKLHTFHVWKTLLQGPDCNIL